MENFNVENNPISYKPLNLKTFTPLFKRRNIIFYKKIRGRGGSIVMSLKIHNFTYCINKRTDCEDHFYVVQRHKIISDLSE